MAKKRARAKRGHNHGGYMLLLGVLVLANLYWAKLDWALFIGGLLALKGLAMLMWPGCCKE